MEDYIEINRNAYNSLYQDYDQRVINKSPYETEASILAESLLRALKTTFKTITILEVGPGSGEILTFFEDNGCRTIAVELSNNMYSISKQRATNTIFIIDDINNVSFAKDQFEGIYAGALIHLFPMNDAVNLIGSFYSWLRPGGVLFINTTIHTISEEGFYEKSDYKGLVKRFRRKWTKSEFLNILQNAKFNIIDQIVTSEKDREKEWIAFICQK